MAADKTQAIRNLYEQLWNRGDMSAADQLCGPSYLAHISLMGDLDTDGLKQMVRSFRSAFPDVRFRIDDILTSGNTFVVRWTSSGTQRGELMGIPPTNRSGETTGIDIFRFEDDKVSEQWSVWDAWKMMQNLGVAPKMGAPLAAQPLQQPSPTPEARH